MRTGMNCRRISCFVFIIFLMFPGVFTGISAENSQSKPVPQQSQRDLTVAAVGDCLILHKISNTKDPQILQLIDILRKADCTYGNCETTFYAPENGFPSYKDFDPNVFCYPFGADELKWMGIDLVSLANNHIMDFEYEGMYSTIENLNRVGIKYAGAGSDLNHAARPGYFESDAGPVALISCCAWLPEKNHQATLPSRYMKGKPGHNAINNEAVFLLDPEHFNKLYEEQKSIFKSAGFPIKEEPGKEITETRLGVSLFRKSDKIDFDLAPNKADMERIIESVRIAKRNARVVIASLHIHDGNLKYDGPTAFQEEFARKCIDAGADMFVVTGPHQLWGIEMYKGKPIFHSIGNLFFQMPCPIISPEAYVRAGLPADTIDSTVYEEKFLPLYGDAPIFDSVVPYMTFDSLGKVKEILLYPIYLDKEKTVYLNGTPRLAESERAQKIFNSLETFSKPYKTKFIFQKGIGKIVLE